MDQGFNDDELADIMNEIESLEQEFQEETAPEAQVQAEPAPEEAKVEQQPEVVAEKVEEPQNEAVQEPEPQTEVVEKLAQKSDEEIQQVQSQQHDDHNVHAIKQDVSSHKSSWQETSMNFSVEGDMKMNLFFNIAGKSVALHIHEGSFEIELEGGMKFSVPVSDQEHKKAA